MMLAVSPSPGKNPDSAKKESHNVSSLFRSVIRGLSKEGVVLRTLTDWHVMDRSVTTQSCADERRENLSRASTQEKNSEEPDHIQVIE